MPNIMLLFILFSILFLLTMAIFYSFWLPIFLILLQSIVLLNLQLKCSHKINHFLWNPSYVWILKNEIVDRLATLTKFSPFPHTLKMLFSDFLSSHRITINKVWLSSWRCLSPLLPGTEPFLSLSHTFLVSSAWSLQKHNYLLVSSWSQFSSIPLFPSSLLFISLLCLHVFGANNDICHILFDYTSFHTWTFSSFFSPFLLQLLDIISSKIPDFPLSFFSSLTLYITLVLSNLSNAF